MRHQWKTSTGITRKDTCSAGEGGNSSDYRKSRGGETNHEPLSKTKPSILNQGKQDDSKAPSDRYQSPARGLNSRSAFLPALALRRLCGNAPPPPC